MSTTTQTATNGRTLLDLDNAKEAVQMHRDFEAHQEEQVREARESRLASIDGEEVRRHVETEEPAPIVLEVAGEEIAAEPVGFGRRLRIGKTLMRAEQLNDEGRSDAIDEMDILDALIDAIDMLDDATPDEYDRDFWDDLSQDDIMAAFRSFGNQANGGGQGNG